MKISKNFNYSYKYQKTLTMGKGGQMKFFVYCKVVKILKLKSFFEKNVKKNLITTFSLKPSIIESY